MYNLNDAINHCKELRTLRVKTTPYDDLEHYYGDDLREEFSPFSHLHELSLEGFNESNYKSALFKSLFATPRLQELQLVDVPNLTDHVLKAAFNYTNDEGEQPAFTSLRKLELRLCQCVTNDLKSIVTADRVPLDYLNIAVCWNVTNANLWNLERFQMDILLGYTYNCSEKNNFDIRYEDYI